TAPLHWWVAYPALLLAMLGLGAVMVWGLRKMARSA
ncbi:transporter, partial [Pseudomonas syringae pv. actinidiae ICMP 18807]